MFAGVDVSELPVAEVHAGALDTPLNPAVRVSSSNDGCGRTGASKYIVAGEPQEAANRIGNKYLVLNECLVQG